MQQKTIILNDESPMPYGHYKGVKMANVPAGYLLWLWDNEKCSSGVFEYVRDNWEVLIQEVKRQKREETRYFS